MSESNNEHQNEYEQYHDPDVPELEEDSYEYVFDDDDDGDGEQPAQSRGQQPRANPNADAEAALAIKDEEVSSLKKRLGDAVRINGERLKAQENEIDQWLY